MSISGIKPDGLQLTPEAGQQSGVNQKSAQGALQAAPRAIAADSKIGDMAFAGGVKRAQLTAQLPSSSNATAKAVNNPLGFTLDASKGTAADQASYQAGGAFYNKQMAVKAGDYQGIQQRITLPTMTTDPTRYYLVPGAKGESLISRIKQPDSTPMDKPSFYQGGKTNLVGGAHGEMDVGLTYEHVMDGSAGKTATFTTNPLGSDMRNAADRFTIDREGKDYVVRSAVEVNGKREIVARESIDAVEKRLEQQLLGKDGKPNGAAPVFNIGTLKGLQPNFAFVPTTRRSFPGITKAEQYHHGNQYYYPQERVDMSVTRHTDSVGGNKPNTGRLTIGLVGGDKSDQYVHAFGMPGLSGDWQPKTVIAIDQFTTDSNGNRVGCEHSRGEHPSQHTQKIDPITKQPTTGFYAEGVKQTSAHLDGAVIESSRLTENRNNKQVLTPIAGKMFYEVRSKELVERNYDGVFQVSSANQKTGGRTVNINPSNLPH